MNDTTWQRGAARDITIIMFQKIWDSAFMHDIRFGQFLTLISRYLQDREGIPDMWNTRDEDWPDILERFKIYLGRFEAFHVPTETDNTE